MDGSCMCCGTPVDTAVRYVGLLDLFFGIASGVVSLIHVQQVLDRNKQFDVNSESYMEYEFTFPQMLVLPTWLCIAFCVCGFIQAIMGVVIYTASILKSRGLCRFWFFVTGITCIFTGFPMRIFEMMVVQEFSHEVLVEQRQDPPRKRKQHFSIAQGAVQPAEALSSVIVPPEMQADENHENANHDATEDPPPSYDAAIALSNPTSSSSKKIIRQKKSSRSQRSKRRFKRASRWYPFFYEDTF